MKIVARHSLLLVILTLSGIFLGGRFVHAEGFSALFSFSATSDCDEGIGNDTVSEKKAPDTHLFPHEAAFIEEWKESVDDGDPTSEPSVGEPSFQAFRLNTLSRFQQPCRRSFNDGRLYYAFARRHLLFRSLLI